MFDNYSRINCMTDQKPILLVSNNSVQDNSPTLLTNQGYRDLWAQKLTSSIVSSVQKLNHITLKQWLLLLLVNGAAITFIVFAYICTIT